jgi:hypothetical protein
MEIYAISPEKEGVNNYTVLKYKISSVPLTETPEE